MPYCRMVLLIEFWQILVLQWIAVLSWIHSVLIWHGFFMFRSCKTRQYRRGLMQKWCIVKVACFSPRTSAFCRFWFLPWNWIVVLSGMLLFLTWHGLCKFRSNFRKETPSMREPHHCTKDRLTSYYITK